MSSVSKFHTFGRLLQPSLLSATLSVAIGLVTALVLLTPHWYSGSDFARYFDSIDITQNSIYENYKIVSQTVNSSNFAADVSVFIAWMIIGLLAYTVVMSLIKLIASVVHFVQDEEYFKEDRERIAREALVRLLVRAIAAVTLYGFYLVLIPFVLSYVFIFAHEALTGAWFAGVWYVVLMLSVIAACVHVVTILLRLMMLRVRVFFDRYSIDGA